MPCMKLEEPRQVVHTSLACGNIVSIVLETGCVIWHPAGE